MYSMRTPCEWTLSDFVPKIRRELVKELHDKRSLNQKEISKILGISQPRVSQYLSDEKKNTRNMSSEKSQLVEVQLHDVVRRTVEDIIKSLDEGKSAPETIPIICYSCRELRMGNALCTLHRFDYPELDRSVGSEKTCDMCLKWKTAPKENIQSFESLDARFNVLKILESISNMLILKPTFSDFIPQIGAQLCLIYNKPDGSNKLEDVAAFPGRIIQVQGRAKIISRPEFNSSKTTGSLLIHIRMTNKQITSVLSIKNQNDIEFEKKLEAKGFLIMKTQALDEQGFVKKLANSEYTQSSKVAIIDSGAIGYEPITYLFVDSIVELVDVFD